MSSSFRIGLIFIDVLHVDLIILRVGSNKLHPHNPGSILHFHDQAILVPRNVESHTVIAANARVPVLLFYVLRYLPARLERFVIPALQGSFRVCIFRLTPKFYQRTLGNHPHSLSSHFGRLYASCADGSTRNALRIPHSSYFTFQDSIQPGMSAAGIGLEMKYPWAMSHPLSRTKSQSSRFSTPSATDSIPSCFARPRLESNIARNFSLFHAPRTKL